MPVADGLFMQEQLWLLLPEELQAPAAAKATLRVIQRRAPGRGPGRWGTAGLGGVAGRRGGCWRGRCCDTPQGAVKGHYPQQLEASNYAGYA